MKKKLSKTLKHFEGHFKDETIGIEFGLTKCEECNHYLGYVENVNSGYEWFMEIETIDDVYEFDNIIGVITSSPFFGLVGILNNIEEKKYVKLIDKLK